MTRYSPHLCRQKEEVEMVRSARERLEEETILSLLPSSLLLKQTAVWWCWLVARGARGLQPSSWRLTRTSVRMRLRSSTRGLVVVRE